MTHPVRGSSIAKAGFDVKTATVPLITAPKGLPRPMAERLENAFVDAMKMEPFVSVARKIAGLYKSEKK